MSSIQHKPVLVSHVLNILRSQHKSPLECFVDATVGLGGHTAAVMNEFRTSLKRIYCIDRDREMLDKCKERLVNHQHHQHHVTFHHTSFARLPDIIQPCTADAIMFDLGVNSLHLDDPSRGFSFKPDVLLTTPPPALDMRFDRHDTTRQTASDFLNSASEHELGRVLRDFGEEPRWRLAARAIVSARTAKPIVTSNDLKDALQHVVDYHNTSSNRGKRRNPLTLIHQALRIVVNDEMGHLARALTCTPSLLRVGGIMMVISFHSGEDRMVKKALDDLYMSDKEKWQIVKKPLMADEDEVVSNRRARSAKLRWVKRLVL